MGWVEAFSILTSITAIVMGIVSILLSIESRNSSKENRKEAEAYNNQAKELLHEIDKRSAVMETKVSENFQKMMDTQSDLISKTLIPQQVNPQDQMGMELMKKFMETPVGQEQVLRLIEHNMPKEIK